MIQTSNIVPSATTLMLVMASFLEPISVSSDQSQLYYVVLAYCRLIGVHDGLARVGRH